MIFGGTGFVGSAIAREAARRGLLVQCVTRGGDAPAHLRSEPWAASVTWLRGDALDPGTYAEHMRGADAVITSVGRLPFPHLTRDVIVRDNGETNVAPARCAAEVGVDPDAPPRQRLGEALTAPPRHLGVHRVVSHARDDGNAGVTEIEEMIAANSSATERVEKRASLFLGRMADLGWWISKRSCRR